MEVPQAMKNVFGEDVKLHPITKRPIEQGRGALSADQQAEQHLIDIEREEGKHVADAMRHQMRAKADMAAANSELAAAEEPKKGKN